MKLVVLIASSSITLTMPSCQAPASQGPAAHEVTGDDPEGTRTPTAGAGSEAPAAGCTATQCSSAPAAATAETRERVDLRDAPVAGPSDAPVTVVVFSDFECPFSARGATTLAQLEQKYGSRVRVAYKEHPLPMHAHARDAAKAALAAGEQGRFWPMHDALFARACAVDQGSFDACAERAGLDMKRYHAALGDPGLEARIEADLAQGTALGVGGTPTFFIDGRRVIGAQPLEDLSAVVDDELTRSP